jgi:uncharacterized repeat protein (TIGR01451 family)
MPAGKHMLESQQPTMTPLRAAVVCLAGLLVVSGCAGGRRAGGFSAPPTMMGHTDPADHRDAMGHGDAASTQMLTTGPAPQSPAVAESPPQTAPVVAQASHHQLQEQAACYDPMATPHGYAPIGPWIANPQGIDPNEFLCDGGDAPPAALARAGDQIIGVEMEDTVARYTTERGEVHVTPSNRVCIYAPRFNAVRRVTGAELGALAIGTQRLLYRDGPNRIEAEQPGLVVTGRDVPLRSGLIRGPDAMRARDRGVPVENVVQPVLAADVLALLSGLSIVERGILRESERALINIAAQAAIVWSVDQEVVVVVAGQTAATVTRDQAARELVIYELPGGKMRLCKLADRSDALPGEVVSFILRIDNVGDSPLHDIVLTDSLTTRLEYLPGSQSSTKDAEFTISENEGQSLRLTWKFAEALPVGEGATVEFKCRVR